MRPRRFGIAALSGRVLFAAAFLLTLATPAIAQITPKLTVVSQTDFPGGSARQFVVHSAVVGRDFVVVVSPPPIFGSWVSADLKAAGSNQRNEKLPAVYALDSGQGVVGPIARMMIGDGIMSPAYVVSVGYPDGQSRWNGTDLLYRPVTDGGVTYGGGGAMFRSFLTEELRPFIEAKYPVDPAKAILFGHSFGGLFAANVLAQSPEDFGAYVVASPSLWIDPQMLTKPIAKGDGRRVFVAVGGEEEPRMVEGTDRLSTALAASGYKVEKKVFAGEDHISYYPLLVQAAFRWLLPPPGAERTVVTLPIENLQRIVGVYQLPDGRVVTVTLVGTKAFVEVTGTPGHSELLPQTSQRFFLPGGYNVVMTFEGGMDAPASAVVINMNGTELRASRKGT